MVLKASEKGVGLVKTRSCYGIVAEVIHFNRITKTFSIYATELNNICLYRQLNIKQNSLKNDNIIHNIHYNSSDIFFYL